MLFFNAGSMLIIKTSCLRLKKFWTGTDKIKPQTGVCGGGEEKNAADTWSGCGSAADKESEMRALKWARRSATCIAKMSMRTAWGKGCRREAVCWPDMVTCLCCSCRSSTPGNSCIWPGLFPATSWSSISMMKKPSACITTGTEKSFPIWTAVSITQRSGSWRRTFSRMIPLPWRNCGPSNVACQWMKNWPCLRRPSGCLLTPPMNRKRFHRWQRAPKPTTGWTRGPRPCAAGRTGMNRNCCPGKNGLWACRVGTVNCFRGLCGESGYSWRTQRAMGSFTGQGKELSARINRGRNNGFSCRTWARRGSCMNRLSAKTESW